jgi:F5/8 type C domain
MPRATKGTDTSADPAEIRRTRITHRRTAGATGAPPAIATLALLAIALAAPAGVRACDCPGELALRHVDSTTFEIVLAWQPVPAASAYVLERATGCDFGGASTYTLSPTTHAYGDTGRAPDDKHRFFPPADLDPSLTYDYRVRARLPDGTELTSSCVSAALASGPVRGAAGDLWADVVLGQPSFAENTFRKTTGDGTQWAGGVVVDRDRMPARIYVADTNHNRVLGVEAPAHCVGMSSDVALGKPYVKSLEPAPQYPDGADAEFTDGQASSAWQTATDSFGYPHGVDTPLVVDLDVDLGAPTTINSVSLDNGALTDRYTAARLDLFVSDDAQAWSQVAQLDNPDRAFALAGTFATTTARYVRFRAHARTGCVDCDWLFLGEGRVGFATAPSGACATDDDCGADAACVYDRPGPPTVVLGQPGFVDAGACNGDGTGQVFPERAPASPSSLCLIHPFQLTIAETVSATEMAVDAAGALYVPDLFNHRVLKYDDPFATDRVADDVWGQADFTGNACNRGAGPTAESLCLVGTDAPQAGVALDGDGNLWVADPLNARVLRFPRTGGAIAHQADVVLGHASFTEGAPGGPVRPLDRLGIPLDVAFDAATGNLYVADSGLGPLDSRILEFQPPFASGMAAARALPLTPFCDFAYPGLRPTSLTLDTRIHGLWVQNSCFFTELFDLDAPVPTALARVRVQAAAGADVDPAGNLYVISKLFDLYRFPRTLLGPDSLVHDVTSEIILPGGRGPTTSDAFYFNSGVTKLGDQLIVADAHRLLVWNDVATPADLPNGAPADDLWGEPDFTSETFQQYLAYPQTHDGRLWVARNTGGIDVLIFDPPLTHDSVPVDTLPLTPGGPSSGYPVLGCPGAPACDCAGTGCSGDRIFAAFADELDFDVAADGDEVWVADRWNDRVFRIANRLGVRAPGAGPFVDVVLGQSDLAGTECNLGAGPYAPTATSLCRPYDLTLDVDGNLWVADNGGEASSNNRLLEFDAAALAVAPGERAKLGVAASRVLGTGGDFETRGEDAARDPLISPFKPLVAPDGYLVVTNNPYATARYPVVYQSPLTEPLPQLALGDFLSYPAGGHFLDADGNLYLTDTNWSRLLVYEQPFAGFAFPCPNGDTIEPPLVKISRDLDPAGDERLKLKGAVTLAADGGDLDPAAAGFRFSLNTGDGTAVVARTLPPGLAATSAAPGWRVNGRATRWTYVDRTGTAAPGVTRAVIARSSHDSGRIKFVVTGKGADFQVRPDELPITLTVVFGNDTDEAAGRCGTAFFPVAGSPTCRVFKGGATLRCR